MSHDDNCREGYGHFTGEQVERGDQLHDEARDRAHEKEMEDGRAMMDTPETDAVIGNADVWNAFEE